MIGAAVSSAAATAVGRPDRDRGDDARAGPGSCGSPRLARCAPTSVSGRSAEPDRAVQVRRRGRACSRAPSARSGRASSNQTGSAALAAELRIDRAGRCRRRRRRNRDRSSVLQPEADALRRPVGSNLARMLRDRRLRGGDAFHFAQHALAVIGRARCVNNCFSCSRATSSARCAEDSTATTMQTIATATMTPIGTTTLKRARSQLVYWPFLGGARASHGRQGDVP